jgi:hypothetical protein
MKLLIQFCMASLDSPQFLCECDKVVNDFGRLAFGLRYFLRKSVAAGAFPEGLGRSK